MLATFLVHSNSLLRPLPPHLDCDSFLAGLEGLKHLVLSVLLISVLLDSLLYTPWVSYVVFL